MAKVEHHQDELFPRVGFIVTNLTLPSRAVVRFYNKRGTAEQWISAVLPGGFFDNCPEEPALLCGGLLQEQLAGSTR